MIEQTSIELSKTCIDSIQNTQGDRNELLLSELAENMTSLARMLGGYYFESRGNVYDLVIENDSIVLKDNLTGYLTLHYNINYFLGCQDLTYDDKGIMRIDFEIDIHNKIIKLKGEDIREREPDLY